MSQPALPMPSASSAVMPPEPPEDLPIAGLDLKPDGPPPVPEEPPMPVQPTLEDALEEFAKETGAEKPVSLVELAEGKKPAEKPAEPVAYRSTTFKGVLYRITAYSPDGVPVEGHWISFEHKASDPPQDVFEEFTRLLNRAQENNYSVRPPEWGLAPIIPLSPPTQGDNYTPPINTVPTEIKAPLQPTESTLATPAAPGQPPPTPVPEGTTNTGTRDLIEIKVDVDKVVYFTLASFSYPVKDSLFKVSPDIAASHFADIVDQRTGLTIDHFTVPSITPLAGKNFVVDFHVVEKEINPKTGKPKRYYNITRIRPRQG